MSHELSEMAHPRRVTKASNLAHEISKAWYRKALDYAEEGKHVAWCMAGFPPEFLVAFDIAGVWPENFGAVCAAYQSAVHFIEIAESDGYSSDLCSYLRATLGYVKELVDGGGVVPEASPRGGMGRATMLLTTGIACDPRTKSLQALGRFMDVPMFVLDTPNPPRKTDLHNKEVKASYVEHYINELRSLVEFLENMTGRPFDKGRMSQILSNSQECVRIMYEVSEMRKSVPSPLPSEDYFSYVPLQLFMQGEEKTLEFYRALYVEIRERSEKRTPVIPDEKYRICTTGLPPWYCLGVFNYMESLGIVPAMDQTYYIGRPVPVDASDPLRAMAERLWGRLIESNAFGGTEISPEPWGIPDGSSGSWPLGQLKNWLESYKLDGIVQFSTRSCRVCSFGGVYVRRVMGELGVPVLTLEVDMADPRGWSDLRVKTQIDTFLDVLESHKQN